MILIHLCVFWQVAEVFVWSAVLRNFWNETYKSQQSTVIAHLSGGEVFFFFFCYLHADLFFNHLLQETYGGTFRSDRKPMMVSYQFECQHQTFYFSQYPQPQFLIECLENEVISGCIWSDNNLIKTCCFICFAKHQLYDLLLILPVNFVCFPSPSYWGLFNQIFWLTLQPATVPHCTSLCIS